MKTIIGLIVLITFIPFTQASTDFEEIKDRVLRPILQCPERVWPGYRPLEHGQFVIAYPSKKIAYHIKQDGSVSETPIERWGEGVEAIYDLSEIEGIKTTILNIESMESIDDSLETLFHEGFHYLGQTKIPSMASDRDEIMPLDTKARIARVMQIKHLKEYNKTQSPESLKRATFWENWIKTNRHEDWKANQVWDVVEGGAEYAGKVSLALANLGCEATEEEIHDSVSKGVTRIGIGTRVDQSYTAGALGYIGAKLKKINEVFERLGDSPVSVLTENCDELEDAEDDSLYAEFEEEFGEANREVSRAKAALEKKPHLLALPWKSVQGAFQPMGFYKIESHGMKIGVTPLTHLTVSDSNGRMVLSGRDLWESPAGACGQEAGAMMLISIDDALDPKSDAQGLDGSYEVVESGMAYGKKLFCPK